MIEAGLTTRTRSVTSSSIASGNIASTDPKPGTKVQKGSQVTLFVSSGAQLITVPDVSGKDQNAASAELGGAGFDINTVKEASTTVPENSVIRTDPAAGSNIAEGSTVTIFVSSGPEIVNVPTLVGLTQANAKSSIEALGLVAVIQEISSGPADVGLVITQTPTAGSPVAVGTSVTIQVGKAAP